MCTCVPSKRIWPLSAAWVPATHLISVDLPAPLSPTSAITSPGADLEVDAAQRLHGAERLGDVAELEEWGVSLIVSKSACGGAPEGASNTSVARCYLQYFLYAPMHTSLFFRNLSVKRRV